MKTSVYGICTDTIRKGDKIVLKDGKRIYGAVGWYRIVNPLEKLGCEVSIGQSVSAKPEDALRLKEKGDVWFCKMADNEGIDNIYAAHREFTGAKFVLDLDDDPLHTNADHPDFQEIEDRKEMRIRMIKMADHVVCATQEIATSIQGLNPHTTVIPNTIDPKIWKVKSKKKKDDKIRIGWMSSGSHFVDLPILQEALKEIPKKYPNVEFHFAGMTWSTDKIGGAFHHVGTTGYKPFPQFYADLNIDIAVCPLKDNQFNNCKSNIKWLEASMLEIPTVASDTTSYKAIDHGKTGYKASTPKQFVKYLSWLIEDKQKRIDMGKAAKKEALKNWNIKDVLPIYENLFDKLDEKKDLTVITAITGDRDKLKPQPEYPGVKYVAYIDKGSDPLWDCRKAYSKFKEPVMNAKIHKVLAHKYCDTPYIVWMDGSMTLKQDPHKLIEVMGDKDFAFFKHPGRDCIYEEAEKCVELQNADVSDIAAQCKEYARQDFPENKGLNELTAFIRKNDPEINVLFEKWWAEICRFSNRDQISFPVIFQGKRWATIPGSIAYLEGEKNFPGNEYFKFKQHKTL